MPDVHCPCGEPWDTYYLRHELPREYLPEDSRWDNEAQAYVDQSDLARFPGKELTHTSFPVLAARDGWEFGGSLLILRSCPSCKRRSANPIAAAAALMDDDGTASVLGD